MTITVPFYNNALSFATNLLCSNRSPSTVDKYDIVHNAIANVSVNESNWKKLILQEIKYSISKKPILAIEDIGKKNIEEMRICRKCGESHYTDVFKAGFNNKTQLQQYRNTCITCHNEIRKSYKKKPLSLEQKEKQRQKNRERRAKEIAKFGKVQDHTAKERYQRWKSKKLKIHETELFIENRPI